MKGKISFDFRKDPGNGNTYTLDLGITNSAAASGPSSVTMVGFAFNEPPCSNGSEAISLLSYNPLSSGYGRVFGNSNRGIRVDPQESLEISNLRTSPLRPLFQL